MGVPADGLSRFAGRELTLDDETFASASATNAVNRAIGDLLRSRGRLQADPDETVDLYTRQSCLNVTARDLAVMAATLGRGGVNPFTGEQVADQVSCRCALVVMATAGLYETSGEWLQQVGLPGKSGIGGGIVMVSPGKGGLGTFGPRLDAAGNSVKGQLAATFLSRSLGLDLFVSAPGTRSRRQELTVDIAHIDWIPEGTRFGADEMTYFVGRGERDVDECSPTSISSSPARTRRRRSRPSCSRSSTCGSRSGCSTTSPTCRRARSHAAGRRSTRTCCTSRTRTRGPCATPTGPARRPRRRPARGVRPARRDAPRPALAGRRRRRTAGHLRVPARLHEPRTDTEWKSLGGALRRAGALGIDEYERVRDDLVQRVIEAKLRKLAALDPATCSVAEWNSATTSTCSRSTTR